MPPKKPAAKKASPKKAAAKKDSTASPKNAAPKPATKKASPKPAAKKAAAKKAAVSPPAPLPTSPPASKKAAPKPSAKKTAPKSALKTAAVSNALPASAPISSPASTPASNDSKSMPGTMIKKGRGVVDVYFAKAATCRVVDNAGVVWQCTLNQTNVGSNNNKFYVIQLLQDEVAGSFYLFTRWGRVGVPGQQATETFSSMGAGQTGFRAKFSKKTGNEFHKPNFIKVAGMYQLMDIDYGNDDEQEEEEEEESAAAAKKKAKAEDPLKSALPKETQTLVSMISSVSAMSSTLRELSIDTKRMPLGKISKDQIRNAYGALQKIEAELKKKTPNVEAATSEFYTLIPHVFGMRRPPLIDSVPMLKSKLDMLDALSQLEVSSTLLSKGAASEENPLDKTYAALKCGLEPLPHTHPEFKLVCEYARNTTGTTHNAYVLEVEEVFKVLREGESARYEEHSTSIGNKQMLWHGSRTTNYVGILSQGLRIAPKEAPCTGYMFGKGIYLADTCTKSANYCCTSRTNNTGIMLLCEAALGKQKEYTNACYMEAAQPGTQSTKGLGRMHPHPAGAATVDGVLWPKGKMVDDQDPKLCLLYPEYIVYDVAQVRMRYLVRMRFNYK